VAEKLGNRQQKAPPERGIDGRKDERDLVTIAMASGRKLRRQAVRRFIRDEHIDLLDRPVSSAVAAGGVVRTRHEDRERESVCEIRIVTADVSPIAVMYGPV
jgi:hypothetical protein